MINAVICNNSNSKKNSVLINALHFLRYVVQETFDFRYFFFFLRFLFTVLYTNYVHLHWAINIPTVFINFDIFIGLQ